LEKNTCNTQIEYEKVRSYINKKFSLLKKEDREDLFSLTIQKLLEGKNSNIYKYASLDAYRDIFGDSRVKCLMGSSFYYKRRNTICTEKIDKIIVCSQSIEDRLIQKQIIEKLSGYLDKEDKYGEKKDRNLEIFYRNLEIFFKILDGHDLNSLAKEFSCSKALVSKKYHTVLKYLDNVINPRKIILSYQKKSFRGESARLARAKLITEFLKLNKIKGRAFDVATLMSKGHSNNEIAKLLFLNEKTIKFHVNSIYKKLNT